MLFEIPEITPQQPIPSQFVFGVPDPASHVVFGENRNPGLRWRDLPAGTRSLVVICVDTDAPTRPDDVNQKGREVPETLPRGRFYHWVMVDISPQLIEIAAGSCADGVTPHGKQQPPGPRGVRQGLNDYTDWFTGDPAMAGDYFGYDGPCPPWNDAIVHHYHFVLYATDLARCPVDGKFTGADVEDAIRGHVLAHAEVVGTYTLNPRLRNI